MTQPPDDHLKALWTGQETETQPMSVEAIRARAAGYQLKMRTRYAVLALLVAAETVIFGHFAWTAPGDVARLGDLLILAGLAWMAWRIRRRWPGALPGEQVPAQSLIEFHRDELLRQRFDFAGMMITAGPMLLGLVVLTVGLHLAHPGGDPRRMIPLLASTLLWLVVAWFVQRRHARRLQRQIDDVDATPHD